MEASWFSPSWMGIWRDWLATATWWWWLVVDDLLILVLLASSWCSIRLLRLTGCDGKCELWCIKWFKWCPLCFCCDDADAGNDSNIDDGDSLSMCFAVYAVAFGSEDAGCFLLLNLHPLSRMNRLFRMHFVESLCVWISSGYEYVLLCLFVLFVCEELCSYILFTPGSVDIHNNNRNNTLTNIQLLFCKLTLCQALTCLTNYL